ncbi:hypothetical protein [Oscillibacter sp.]|uniref:hypothetical protein n=1 Tax=Oscillibacter sp. TaxID=1945593 RepID=UPI0028980CC4|nr:hypothetical protein [Oscillibacter sp.]
MSNEYIALLSDEEANLRELIESEKELKSELSDLDQAEFIALERGQSAYDQICDKKRDISSLASSWPSFQRAEVHFFYRSSVLKESRTLRGKTRRMNPFSRNMTACTEKLFALPKEKKFGRILTVHASQGRKWDTQFLSVVDTNNKF